MKVMVVTTPQREAPEDFPPIGSLSVIDYLKKNGYPDTHFYHIDALRPRLEAAADHIASVAPDVLGISAVVSTAYAFTKLLAAAVRQRLPDCLIVVGGNLAASAEVLLTRTAVDLCVLGEGERVFRNVVERAATTRVPAEFFDIPGLALLGADGRLVNTGYEAPLTVDEIFDYNWADLEAACDIAIYIAPAFDTDGQPIPAFARDERTCQPHRRDKRITKIPGSKGCVARCTFCHRWDKGIRYIPVDRVMRNIEYLVEHHNVGFISMGDENFGTNRRWLAEFCERIKHCDILWRVAGMRVNCVSPEIIAMMKDAGCCGIIYGMETGSERMLQVMDKKVKLQDNYNAMRWTIEAGLDSVVQLVIGMPGESPETIAETIEFTKFACSIQKRQSPFDLSINYAQALPGTPLYEFGRRVGLIGRGVEGEEEYLLRISDKNAHDEHSTLNFTAYPALLCQTWRQQIQLETFDAYISRFGVEHYRRKLLEESGYFQKERKDEAYFANPKRLIARSLAVNGQDGQGEPSSDRARIPGLVTLLAKGRFGLASFCHPRLFKALMPVLTLLTAIRTVRRLGLRQAWPLVRELTAWMVMRKTKEELDLRYASLRKIVFDGAPETTDDAMMPLRRGR